MFLWHRRRRRQGERLVRFGFDNGAETAVAVSILEIQWECSAELASVSLVVVSTDYFMFQKLGSCGPVRSFCCVTVRG